MIRSMAVTTDFSPLSRRPFGAAAAVARRFGARLSVLHVVSDPEIITPWQTPETSPEERCVRRAAVERQLEDLIASEPAFRELDVRPRAILGNSVGDLCRFQEDEGIDLVIIASHGGTGAEHVVFGNFAAKVVQLISCPVLVFREAAVSEKGPWSVFAPRRILVPHDLSRAAATGLRAASLWARHFEASIRLLYVVDLEGYDQADHTAESVQAFFARLRDEARQELERMLEAEHAGTEADAVVRMGHPATEILKETDDYRADLVIVAGRDLSDLGRLQLGGVGARTIQGASCPVLVVKDSKGGR